MAGVGTLAVNLIAETAAFDRRMKRSGSIIEKFALTVAKTESRLGFLSSSALVVGRSVSRMSGSLSRMSSIVLAPLKGLVAAAAAVQASTIALGAASVTAAADYEVLGLRLKKIIGTKKEADEAFRESIQLASSTPYSIDQIVETRIALEQMGIKGVEAVESIADASAAMGRDVKDVAAALRSLEVEPLRNLGLSDKDLETIREIKSAKGYEPARKAVLEIFKGYKGATEELSLTLPGLISTFKDNVKILRAEFGEGFLGETKLFVNDLIEGAKSLRQGAKEAGIAFGDEVMRARAALLAGFEVSLKIAGQIKEAMKQEGGIGTVILESLNLGATLLGKALLTAFEVSLPLWKTIGTILGQGVLNALYQSGIPGAGIARKAAIESNLGTRSAGELRKLAIAQGFDVKFQAPVMEMKTVGFGATYEQTGVRAKTSAELANDIADQIVKTLSIGEQLTYANVDPAGSIAKSVKQSSEILVAELKNYGAEAVAAIQQFQNAIAKTAGQAPIDIADTFASSFEEFKKEGEKLNNEIRDKLNASGEELAGGMKNQIKGIGESAAAATGSIQEMLNALDFEYSMLGKIGEARERALELARFQELVQKEYVGDIARQNELMQQYTEKLDKIASGKRGYLAFTTKIAEWGEQVSNVWSNLGDIATNTLNSIADALTETVMRAKVDWKALGRAVIKEVLAMIIKLQMLALWQAITGTGVSTVSNIGAYTPTPSNVPSTGGQGMVEPSLQHGGEVLKTGWAKVHEGEFFSGVNGSGLTVNVNNTIADRASVDVEEDLESKVLRITINAAAGNGAYRRSHNLMR
ncbi:MAG: hypothetical protein JW837_18180 [Sedimentisphaerales bacterium]|nr:hypothetical protein [Sedimentisphaerales bacterium]